MSMLPPSLFFLPLRSGVPSLIIIMGCMFLFKALEKGEKAGSSEDEDEDENIDLEKNDDDEPNKPSDKGDSTDTESG